MDPNVLFGIAWVAVQLNLYDGLMRWEDNPPKQQLWLAESHSISADGLVYTFKLRHGVKFHDGTELTSSDVVFSVERVLALKQGPAALFSALIKAGSTTAPDPYTVEFHLEKPSATFLSRIHEISVVNAKLVKSHEDQGDWGSKWLSTNDAGSGSFMLERFDPAVGFSAVRFKDHFMGWRPKYLDSIQFRTVREQTTRVLGLIKGDFQGTDGYLPQEQLDQLRQSGKVQLIEQPSMRVAVIEINNQRPPFDDLHVRKAISYAFDYNSLIENVLRGTVVRNAGPIPENMWGYPKQESGYTFDLTRAKAELEQASRKIDRPIIINSMVGYNQTDTMAQLLQNGLRKIGIEAKIAPETFATLAGKCKDPATAPDMWIHWVSTYYPDPHNWVGEMYNSTTQGSWISCSWYKNAEVDALLGSAVATTGQEERAKMYEKATSLVMRDAASVWIYNTKWNGPFSKNVHGVRYSPIGDGQEMRWIYIE
jgi:peptide/nickel transport system substrate-binding protein